jgi:P4 family phage/plasmid primase-like protien
MNEDKIIRSWDDLSQEEKKCALTDDVFFASMTSAYPGADFSARDALLQRYTVDLRCTYCDTLIQANFLSGLPDFCPACKRKSDGLVINPSKVAQWLEKYYIFKAAFIGMKARLYVYNEAEGYFSERGAEAVLARESKLLYGDSFTSQKLTNVRINLISDTVSDEVKLFPAVRQIEDGIAINVKNGVVCLTGPHYENIELKPHDPKYMFAGVLPINYNPQATAFEILKFISQVSEGDVKLGLSILEAFAYTLIPGYPIHKAIMLQGPHNNGKSTTLQINEALLGKENVANMSLQRITYNRFALDWLQNKLANISPDLPTQEISDGGVFKALTGGDIQLIERKGDQTPGQLDNIAKLMFTANELPKSADNTSAFYDRWLILQFQHTFDAKTDPLPKLITPQELSGLFNILVRYFVPTLMQNRCFIGAPADINTTRDIYLKNSDNVRAFAEACLQYEPEADVLKADFYAAYLKYCDRFNLIAKPEIGFWKVLKQAVSYTEHRPERGGVAWIRGQALSLPQEDEEQAQKLDIKIVLKEERYGLYSKFLEEKVPPEVFIDCTENTRITKVSPPSAITLEGGKIKEYIVKSLLSLFSLCNNEPETQNSAPNPAEISAEPSKILVNPVNSEQDLTPNSAVDQEKAPKVPNPANQNSNASAAPAGEAMVSVTFPSPSLPPSPQGQEPGKVMTQQPGPDPKLLARQKVLSAVRHSAELGIPFWEDAAESEPNPALQDDVAALFVDEIKKILVELEKVGDIYSPRPGYWRVVRADDVDA